MLTAAALAGALALLVAATAPRGVAAAVAPPLLPGEVVLVPVATVLHVDGVAHAAYAFRSVLPPRELAAAVTRLWRADAERGVVTDIDVAGWRVLGRRVGAHHETVQLRPDGRGTSGYVAARSLDAPPDRVPAAPFTWPGGTRVLRTTATGEPTALATQIVALVPHSPESAGRALEANVRRAGWHADPAGTADAPAKPALRGRPLRWTRGREELWLVVVPHEHAAAVVAHHVRAAGPGMRP